MHPRQADYVFAHMNNPRCRYKDENLRNSACRALIVLTNSSPELKLVLLNHEATRDVLLQQISSFDDDLKGARGSYRVLISGTVSPTCSVQLLQ